MPDEALFKIPAVVVMGRPNRLSAPLGRIMPRTMTKG